MRVAIGIPNNVAGATGATLAEWARRAERLGFSSIAVIDRLGHPCFVRLVGRLARDPRADRADAGAPGRAPAGVGGAGRHGSPELIFHAAADVGLADRLADAVL